MINDYLTKTTKNKKRIGRGYGSGKGGHTVGRGSKGAKSRTGYKKPRQGFEGGQMPLSRRLPKLKGFSRSYFQLKNKTAILNLGKLNAFKDGEKVNLESLRKTGLIKTKQSIKVKILGNGELTKKIIVENLEMSASAREKITKAGGEIL